MVDIELVGKIAKDTFEESVGSWLWARTSRITSNAQKIAQMVGEANSNVPIDKFCLISAAYFNDSGLIYKRKKDKPQFIDMEPKDIAEFSTLIVNSKLGSHLTSQRLLSINNIIGEGQNRFTKVVEAMVLSDAIGLEDIGLTGLLNQYRKLVVQGFGPEELVKNFKRKLDYQYFDARLKEGFRFDFVRKIAAKRLESVKGFIQATGNSLINLHG